MTATRLVSQKALAAALGLTPRRIRQLVEMHIIEQRSGGYDVATCRERLELYRHKNDREAWNEYYSDVNNLAGKVETLMATTPKGASTEQQIQLTSQSVQELFSCLRFIASAQAKTKAERDFFVGLWRAEEDAALHFLLGRA